MSDEINVEISGPTVTNVQVGNEAPISVEIQGDSTIATVEVEGTNPVSVVNLELEPIITVVELIEQGEDGQDGASGVGVPAGGTAGQVLAKIDATDYNTEWVNQASGTVVSVNGATGVVVLDTDDVSEGSANFYFTNERVDDEVSQLLSAGPGISLFYDDNINQLSISASGGGCCPMEYVEGDSPTGAITGGVMMMKDSDGVIVSSTGSASGGLLVEVSNAISIAGPVSVSANDLDIRNLLFATDKVDVSGSTVGISGTVPVSATNLDIRDLTFAADKVDASGTVLGAGTNNIGDVDVLSLPSIPAGNNNIGDVDVATLPAVTQGTSPWVVSGSVTTSGTATVTATDLDIRNLTFAQDKVDASGTTLGANSGVDVGDVTINNASGAAAVNVQDGGNSLTIDGTVAISGSVAVTNAALSVVGGGAEATALRVTIANDSTGLLSVDDNGGSLTVDGTVAATQSGTWNINNISGTVSLPTGAATSALQTQPGVDIGDVTINNSTGAAAVNIQDGGNSITVDGTVTANAGTNLNTSALALAATQTDGTQKSINRGVAKGATVAGDVTSTAQSTDRQGLDVQIRTSSGVAVDTFGGGSVTQGTSPWVTADNQTIADNTGFTDGTSKVLLSGHVFDEVAGTALTENDAAASRIDSKRAQVLVIEDETTRGRRTTVTAANALKVDGSAVTQPVSIAASVAVTLAAGAASIGKAEDSASVDLDVGVPAMAIRKATPANTSNNDGDYEMLQMSVGRLWTSSTIDAALPAGTNAIGKLSANSGVDIGDVDITSVVPGVGATNLGKQEDQPHTSGDTGVLFLGVRSTGTTVFTDTNGDYNPIAVSSTGQTYIGSIVPGTTATELGKAEDNAHSTGHTGVMHLGVSNLNLANDFSGTDGDYTPIAVAANGAAYAAVYRATTTLTAINITYNATTTATSAAVDCVNATMACLAFSLTESGTATDITFEIQTSDDNSTFFPYRRMPFGLLRWDDATISSYGTLTEQIEFPVIQRYVKVKVTAVGTDASNTFTVASARLSIRNGG